MVRHAPKTWADCMLTFVSLQHEWYGTPAKIQSTDSKGT